MSAIQDQLDQLQAQVQQLQAQLAAATADSLAPNYLTIDAEGQVSANFSGVINAYGLLLPTYLTGGKASESFIKWIDPDDGKLSGGIVVEYQPAGQMYTVMQANAEQAADLSQVNLQARDDTDTTQASLNVTQEDRGNSSSVNAFAGAQSAKIIDNAGNSSFARAQQSGSFAYNIPAGGNQVAVLNLAVALPNDWLVLLNFNQSAQAGGGQNSDHLGWCIISQATAQLQLSVANLSSATAQGTAYFTILNLTN